MDIQGQGGRRHSDVAAVRQASREMVRELGLLQNSSAALSPSQCHALLEIGESPGLTQSALAERLRVNKSTASRIVRQLAARGWVTSRPDLRDTRRRPLHLSPRGRARLERVQREADERVGDALGLLDDMTRAAVRDGLAIYAAALERSRRRAACSVRRVRPGDNAAIAAIVRGAMREFDADGPGSSISDVEIDDMAGAYRGRQRRYFVAVEAARVIGGGGVAPLAGGERWTCELRKMYLEPAARGLGLGRELLARCLDAARRAGFRRMYLETMWTMAAARTLYERHGFAPVARPMGHTGHFGCDAWYMRSL